MIWIGLDVHKSFTTMGLFDPANGELSHLGDVPTEQQELTQALARIPGAKTVVLEAGRKSHWVAGMVEPCAQAVWIVDPLEVRRLQGRKPKTDRRDAAALARWAAKGALTPLWRPEAETMDLRELTRGRIALVRMEAKLRNMIRSLCARHGQEPPKGDLLSEKLQGWLEGVKLGGYAGRMLELLRGLLPVLQGAADSLTQPVEQEAKAHPQARRLMTIPGIGPVLGLTIAVEVGDILRFPSPANLRSYSGLCPRVSASGGRTHTGPLTKSGNRWLRWGAVLGAQQIANKSKVDPRLKRLLNRVAFRHGRNPAKVACARALLDLIWHLLSKQQDWRAPLTRAA
jgi:transposase